MKSNKLPNDSKKNTNKKSKRKLIGIFTLGGLILTGPFAAFAINNTVLDTNNQFNNSNFNIGNFESSLINEPDYDKQIEHLEKEIEKKISQANSLIEMMNESSVDIAELNEIVSEFVKLETFLEEVQAEKQESDYLKEIFFDEKMQSVNLSDEFRNILTSSLTEEQIQSLKKEVKITEEIEMIAETENFTAETLELIDSDLAKSYANGELTNEEVKEKVKEIMNSMSYNEKEELFDEFKDADLKFSHNKYKNKKVIKNEE